MESTTTGNTRFRVVFDCSAKYLGTCLNDVLLQGPDLTNNLTSVLLRFRTEPVALTSDIEKMFYQVKVQPEDRNFLRFYWLPDGDTSHLPDTYRMTVHLFGASSSLSVASYALQLTAENNRDYFDQTIINTMKTSFYVDDFICSVPSEEEAKHLVPEVTFLCELGAFRLTKWVSNRNSVLEVIPVEYRATSVHNLISDDSTTTEHALGIRWYLDRDTLGIMHGDASQRKPTRRNILSLVCSVYDPLGLVAPLIVILPAKIILQDMCREKTEWNDALSGTHLHTWNQWLQDFHKLCAIEVPRCLKPANFGDTTNAQIHHFADASEKGYGVATCIISTNTDGQVHCMLLFSRSRVAPLKKVTMPRMDLTAATVAVCISLMITQQLGLVATHTFWTDSMLVIRYIANETTRFHTFVANRVALIRENCTVDQWRYVESSKNPANMASRGITVDHFLQDESWIKGPSFLRQPEDDWPPQPDGIQMLPARDPEVKTVNTSTANPDLESDLLDYLFVRHSSLTTLRHVLG